MAIWQSIVKITLTLLLSGLVVVIIAAFLKLRFTDKSLYEILLSRKKIVLFFLVLLILLMPVVFSLPKGTLLSPKVLAVYVRELLVSVVVVVSFSFAWKALDLFKGPYTVSLALHPGEVRLSNVERMQLQFLAKWIDRGDITAWHELMERIRSGDELRPRVRSVVEWKLWQVRKGFSTEPRHIRDDDYEGRLEALFSPQSVANIYSDVEEMQVFSLAKWIDRGDITGWYELKEDVDFGDGLRPGVRSVVEWMLQVQEGFRTKAQKIRNDDARRLKSLLSLPA